MTLIDTTSATDPIDSSELPDAVDESWQQGKVVAVTIADLSHSGDGVGRWGQRVVFVPDTVPGDHVTVRLVRVKPQYAHGKLQQVLSPSPHRIRPGCIVADKCGGCQWQPIDYEYQLTAKRQQVVQALERIAGLVQPPVDPVLAAASPLEYRNKATYPLGRSGNGEAIQAGYYQKGTHRLINLNQCPVQDPRLNPLLATVKQDIQRQGWRVYDEQQHKGQVRHLSLRIGRRTGEILLTLVVRNWNLPGVEAQAQEWLARHPSLVGVCLNYNPERTNTIFGPETRCIDGLPSLREEFAGLQFQVQPDTFFQVHTEQAEALLAVILDQLQLQGHEIAIDAYCGIGTLSLPLAQQVQHLIGLEVQPTAIALARQNAALNGIENVSFQVGTVETLLPALAVIPDIVVLDPPRKGCDAAVIDSLKQTQPEQIVYVSCNPATLARDLKQLCQPGLYQLMRVQPVDFFPQTAHVECAAFLVHHQGQI